MTAEVPDSAAPSRGTTPTDRARSLLDGLHGRLIVSCQARPGDPLRAPRHMAAMAASVTASAPVAAIRAQGVEDLRAIRAAIGSLPLVGLWKDGGTGVYITPTAAHAEAIAEAGADVVAVDGTGRPRPDGKPLQHTIEAVHRCGALVMADVSTSEEGVAAAGSGADLVASTLSGYTPYSTQSPEPDLTLVAELSTRLDTPVVAEGRLHTPDQARAAIDAGAWAVVVGTAVTAPGWLAGRFAAALP